jgi:uncharacterized protein (UPF0332 family)
MTNEEYTLISYRMERAHESLDEAEMILDSGRINAHVNRLYYACFYAVSALLLTRDFSTSKHGYLRSLMHREFVKTGIIPKTSQSTSMFSLIAGLKGTTLTLFDLKQMMLPGG